MTIQPDNTINLWSEILRLYENTDRNFITDLEWHIKYGYIFSGPDYFLMVADLEERAWFVHLAIGSCGLAKFISLMPHYRPLIGWSRDPSGVGEIRWYSTDRFVKHI